MGLSRAVIGVLSYDDSFDLGKGCVCEGGEKVFLRGVDWGVRGHFPS